MIYKIELLSIGESAEYLGISIDTLRRWEAKGAISAYRSPGKHRYFAKNDLDNLFGKKYVRVSPPKTDEESLITEKPRNISDNNVPEQPIPAQSIKEEAPIVRQPAQDFAPPPPQPITSQEKIRRINFTKIPWSKLLIVGIVIFAIFDIVLLIAFLTSNQPLVSPIP